MRLKVGHFGLFALGVFLFASAGRGQIAESAPAHSLEGHIVINLPSVEVFSPGTLTFLITHRFLIPVQDSSIHDLYSLGDHADIGLGLGYVPMRNLDVSFYRSSELELYEVAAKYRLYSRGFLAASLRAGEDWRTEHSIQNRSSVFVQGILAASFGSRVRITAVPTYLSRTSAELLDFAQAPSHDRSCLAPSPPRTLFLCSGLYDHIFNVPVGVSLVATRTIAVHGEVTPRYGRADSGGVGWVVSIEKTVPGHRFSFAAGNQRDTTVDRYTAPLLPSRLFPARSVYLGFNITRDWDLR